MNTSPHKSLVEATYNQISELKQNISYLYNK